MNGLPDALGPEDYTRFVEQGLEGTPQGYILLGTGGTVLAANAIAAERLGLARPLPVGLRIGDVFAEVHDFRGQPMAVQERPAARAFATREVVRETLIGTRLPGDTATTWIEVTASPLFDAAGAMWGVLEVLVDATERLETERRLHRLASIVEATDHGAVVTDLERRIEWVNPAFTRWTGFSFDEVAGRNPGDLLQCAETDPETVARMRECLDAGEGFHEEILNHDRQGRRRWIDLEVQPLLNHLGEHTHWMGLKRDITERRAVEAELRSMTRRAGAQTHALEIALEHADELTGEIRAAGHAKDQFLQAASRELRTPLGGALLAVRRLHDAAEDEPSRALARFALDWGERALGLVDDLLRLSNLAVDGSAPTPRVVSMRTLLRDLEWIYRDTARARGVDFEVRSGRTDLPTVRTDPGMLWQILVELLDDVFATAEAGSVLLDLDATVGERRWDLRFRVRDTEGRCGVGDPHRVFEPFARANGTARGHGARRGLGLAIARECALRLGGRLERLGEPTSAPCFEFTISLPAASPSGEDPGEETTAVESSIAHSTACARRVLLAAGDGPRRPILTRMLRTLGAHVDVIDGALPIPEDWIGVHHDVLLVAGDIDAGARAVLFRGFEARSKPRLRIPSSPDEIVPDGVTAVADGFDVAVLGAALSQALAVRT